MADGYNLQDLDTTDNAAYEWLLSDHPDARAERARRRAAYYKDQRETAAKVRAWVDKINATADPPQTARELAQSMGPLADASAVRAEAEFAEPDDAYVARLRRDWETYMQVSGPPGAWDYQYPAHLTGTEAANHAPPVAPHRDEPETSS